MFRLFIAKNGWVALVILAIAAGFGSFALQQRSLAAALDDHGVTAVATVEGMRTETHRRRSTGGGYSTETDHLVRYAFRAPPAAHMPLTSIQVEREVPEFVWDELSVGEQVEIRYLPEDPERVEAFPGQLRRDAWFLLLMAGCFGLTGLCMIPFPLRAAWRAQRLEAAGMEAQGVIEKARLRNGRWRVWVRFRDATGIEREADASVEKGSSWMDARVGHSVRLRYDPANPSNIAPA